MLYEVITILDPKKINRRLFVANQAPIYLNKQYFALSPNDLSNGVESETKNPVFSGPDSLSYKFVSMNRLVQDKADSISHLFH